MYRDMMNDLASSWKDILQAQSIAVNHIPEVRKQEISRGFGKKETVYTVSESDAYNIQALYKRVTAERIYNIDKVLQQLPKITKAVNTLYEQTKALGKLYNSHHSRRLYSDYNNGYHSNLKNLMNLNSLLMIII